MSITSFLVCIVAPCSTYQFFVFSNPLSLLCLSSSSLTNLFVHVPFILIKSPHSHNLKSKFVSNIYASTFYFYSYSFFLFSSSKIFIKFYQYFLCRISPILACSNSFHFKHFFHDPCINIIVTSFKPT